MIRPPRIATVLTAAGAIPFVFGAAMTQIAPVNMGDPETGGYPLIIVRDGVDMLHSYGLVILCFMSGTLWSFAANDEVTARIWPYVISVIPALYAWGYVPLSPSGPDDPLLFLMLGFIGLLGFDYTYQRVGLAPAWWMTLRLPVSGLVVLCLWVGWSAQ